MSIRLQQMTASVLLIKALGGGWRLHARIPVRSPESAFQIHAGLQFRTCREVGDGTDEYNATNYRVSFLLRPGRRR